MTGKEITIDFESRKTTDNTVVFKEVPPDGRPPIVGSLYVQKWFLGKTVPRKIAVTLTVESE